MHLLFLRTASACIRRCQLPLQFRPFPKMNCDGNELEFSGRGRGSIPSGNSSVPHDPVMVDGHSLEAFSGVKGNNSTIGRQALQQQKEDNISEGRERTPMLQNPYKQNLSFSSGKINSQSQGIHQVIDSTGLVGIGLKQDKSQSASMFKYEDNFPMLSADAISSRSKTRNRSLHTMRTKIEVNMEDRKEDISSVKLESSPIDSSIRDDDESSFPTRFGKKGKETSHGKQPEYARMYHKKAAGIGNSDFSDDRRDDVSSVQLESSPIESSIGDDDESSFPTRFGKRGKASNGKGPEYARMYCKKAAGIGNSDCSEDRKDDVSSVQLESLPTESSTGNDESSLPTRFGKKHMHGKGPKHAWGYPNKPVGIQELDCSEGFPMNEPFDICQSGVRPKLSSNVKNGKNQHKLEHASESIRQVLRPGMILLKSYITHSEQIEMVKICRELGLGQGGFYRPSYRDGAKLRLQMMCLGLNWDLETRKYDKIRKVDGSKPPDIPHGFSLLVEKAIQDSHSLINEEQCTDNVEDILPRMSPDICIVNFYTTGGRLGLHQDRDESSESRHKGLPVVSFSVGDSAEFLYGDHRDADKAKKVVLESGDVLIFGGSSRHIYHGVSSIVPHSAPMALREETKLRPGRLNLTLRQY